MARIRVLIVDDSVVIRKILTDALSGDPDIEIAGLAANGRIALAKIPQVNPDLVTLDVEMPEMNGLQTLAELRKKYPMLPVIMFSTLTQRGAEATLDALTLGASDYVTKPANVGSVTTAIQRIREQLIPKIKMLAGKVLGITVPGDPPAAEKTPLRLPFKARPAVSPPSGGRIDAVCIGVSTGGPNALLELIPSIQPTLPVPILIVQHMPPVFTRALADRLAARSQFPVVEAAEGMAVRPGAVWIAPGGFHLRPVKSGAGVVLKLNQDPPENSCRPAADVLFRSAVEVYGGHVLGVVLTGMGQDGLRGCQNIKDAGGEVFVQDEATSVVWGMPGFVANAGLADRVLPLQQIAMEIQRRAERGRERVAVATTGRPS
jgi:two-component system chemotaxis response regulator CheB